MGALRLDGIRYLSPSALNKLSSCERQWWHHYIGGLKDNARSEPLAMGAGLATAQECQSIEAGLREYRASRPEQDGWTDPDAYQRAGWIGEHTIRLAYAGYTARWPDHTEAYSVAREPAYLVRIPGHHSGYSLQVRIDGHRDDGWLIEDKLRSGSSMRAEALENERAHGIQLTAEVYVHWRVTGDVLPVLFRNVKKIDPRKLKGAETEADIADVLAAHFDGDGIFNEWEVTRTLAQLEWFEEELRELVARASDLAASDRPAGTRNTGVCHAYGRTCPAIDVCRAGVFPEDEDED